MTNFEAVVPKKEAEVKWREYDTSRKMDSGVYIRKNGNYVVVFPELNGTQAKLFICSDGGLETLAEGYTIMRKVDMDVKVILENK